MRNSIWQLLPEQVYPSQTSLPPSQLPYFYFSSAVRHQTMIIPFCSFKLFSLSFASSSDLAQLHSPSHSRTRMRLQIQMLSHLMIGHPLMMMKTTSFFFSLSWETWIIFFSLALWNLYSITNYSLLNQNQVEIKWRSYYISKLLV
jgi:hypothetical protein